MFSFYSIVVIIAIIILIVVLTVVGLTLKNKKNTNPFPDYQNTCPDFWTLDANGNKCIPKNMNIPPISKVNAALPPHEGVEIYTDTNKNKSIKSIDLSEDNWVGVCDKSSWAKKYGILWDGVTNNNTCT